MTHRRLKVIVATGDIVIDGYQGETWFIVLSRDVKLSFRHLVGGRLYTLVILQSGDKQVAWPAYANAATLDPRSGSLSVQTFFANGQGDTYCQSISAMTYLEN